MHLIDILEAHQSTNGWWVFNCPNCDHGRGKRKCAVNFEYSFVKCWECGLRCFLDKFLVDFHQWSWYEANKYRGERVYKSTNKSEVSLPDGFRLLSEPGGFQARIKKYILNRGFTEEFLNQQCVGYCEEFFGYLVIPFINHGKLVYWIAREALGRAKLKYINPKGVHKDMLYNEDALYLYDQVYLVEGVIDSWTIGYNSVATMGWTVSQAQINKINNSPVKRVIIVPDPGYKKEAYKLASKIDKEVFIKEEGPGDVNEIGREAFGELPVEKFSYKNWVKNYY